MYLKNQAQNKMIVLIDDHWDSVDENRSDFFICKHQNDRKNNNFSSKNRVCYTM
jgi:hypothetical protein